MRRVTVAAIIAAAALAAAGCSSSSSSSTLEFDGFHRECRCRGAGDGPAGFSREHHACLRAGRPEGGLLRQGSRLGRDGASRPPSAPGRRRRPRCWPASLTPPTSARTRPSTRGRSPTAPRSRSSPAPRPAAPRWWSRRGSARPAQLKGKTLATPSLGNTQDVALRYWLKQNGIATTTTGGGDAFIKPTTPNSAAVLEFKSGQIAGGSEPAPYDIEMVSDGGTVLLSEPGVTTLLVVTQSFLSAHPGGRLGPAQGPDPGELLHQVQPVGRAGRRERGAGRLHRQAARASSLVAAAFKEITFTNDPDESSLTTDASQAVSLGLLKPVNLNGIFDLTPLNQALAAAGQPQISS